MVSPSMSKRSRKPPPTTAELDILNVLWTQGPCTVRQVHEALERARGTGYTTTLKLMQLMADKGLVRRNVSQRSHVYRPNVSEEKTQRRLVGDLMDRAFSGSASQLVMRALAVKPTDANELDEIRGLLDELEAQAGRGPGARRQGDGS